MIKRIVENDRLKILDEDGEVLFTIQEEIGDNAATLKLGGEITMEVSHEFEDELTAVISVCDDIVIDFGKVRFISSQGIHALLTAQRHIDRKGDARMRLRNVGGDVMRTFRDIGFCSMFEFERCQV